MLENLPKTLIGILRYFEDPLTAIQFVAFLRWGSDEPVCFHCHETGAYFLASRKIYKCKKCRKQFSVKMGTIFEESAVSLDKWLAAIWLIANCKNGISSYETARHLGVRQRTAWFMNHRIRTAVAIGSIEKLSGEVETDETYIGGDSKNMHSKKRKRRVKGPGSPAHKTAVIGMVQRGGKVRAKVTRGRDAGTIRRVVTENVEPGAEVITDEWRGYINLRDLYALKVINHSIEYVRENVHTNNIENFWSLLKRTIKGTYISVSPAHLQKYVEEQMFRYNERKGTDRERFVRMIEAISGKRLTWNQLVNYEIPC